MANFSLEEEGFDGDGLPAEKPFCGTLGKSSAIPHMRKEELRARPCARSSFSFFRFSLARVASNCAEVTSSTSLSSESTWKPVVVFCLLRGLSSTSSDASEPALLRGLLPRGSWAAALGGGFGRLATMGDPDGGR